MEAYRKQKKINVETDILSGKRIGTRHDVHQRMEQTIKGIKSEYRSTEKKIKASGISHATVNIDSLIKAECHKNNVKESVIRIIAGWKNIKSGGGSSKMLIKENNNEATETE